MTPEERMARHVDEIANRHIKEMKASWRRKNHPGFIAQEVSQPYRCETCGSTSVNMCIGFRCFARYVEQNPISDEQREMLRRATSIDLNIAMEISKSMRGEK